MSISTLTSDAADPRVARENRTLPLILTDPSAAMLVDIEGRTEKITLGPKRALQPLFEAVANSIYSIQDIGNPPNGRIDILIERGEVGQDGLFDNSDQGPIVNFTVRDNGIGFTETNFDAFNRSDFKHKPGARGIGRFLWLVAFEMVHVESTFAQNGTRYKRSFDFVMGEKGIEHPRKSAVGEGENETVVRLIGFRDKYQAACEKRIDTIADKIIEHFLFHFTRPGCPKITLRDGKDERNLNEEYERDVKGKNQPAIKFKIKDQEFEILHLQLYLSREKNHRIHYCAAGRAVKNMDALSRIPNLAAKKIVDSNNKTFKYSAYVSGPYLDKNVTDDRTNFNIPASSEDDLDLDFNQISWDEVQRHAAERAKEFLKEYLEPIGQSKMQRIKKYIETQAPEYRPILRYRADALENIRPDLSDADLDTQLHKLLFQIEAELKEQTRRVLSSTPGDITDLDKYKQNYKKLVETVNDVSTSKLAQHVIHRKLILDLLERFLALKETGEYEREDVIHQAIFPMKKTSDQVLYEQQNLWIIDEKLSYHRFLASDKALSTYKVLKTKDGRRPDITIFVGEAEGPYQSVVLIEFKRSMREGYTDEDPIRKLYEIANTIREGEGLDDEGRTIKTFKESTRFYCYLICDIVAEQIKEHARMNHLIESPGGLGYFGYHPEYSAYMEIIDYQKLLSDARKRNRILFDKLDLPSNQ